MVLTRFTVRVILQNETAQLEAVQVTMCQGWAAILWRIICGLKTKNTTYMTNWSKDLVTPSCHKACNSSRSRQAPWIRTSTIRLTKLKKVKNIAVQNSHSVLSNSHISTSQIAISEAGGPNIRATLSSKWFYRSSKLYQLIRRTP